MPLTSDLAIVFLFLFGQSLSFVGYNECVCVCAEKSNWKTNKWNEEFGRLTIFTEGKIYFFWSIRMYLTETNQIETIIWPFT